MGGGVLVCEGERVLNMMHSSKEPPMYITDPTSLGVLALCAFITHLYT